MLGKMLAAVLRVLVPLYLATIPDDEYSDQWDNELQRSLTYREETQRSVEWFIHWIEEEVV